MKRREFITLISGAAMWPVSAEGQQVRMPVVGVLNSLNPDALSAFRGGLSETGYVEGLNVLFESRTTSQADRLPSLAAELVQRQVAVVAALGGLSAPAAKAVTTTIPVVFSIGGDPVELGLVSNLSRPGGNITGITFFTAELLQKQVGLMRELVPKAVAFGVLANPNNPRHKADAAKVQAAAEPLGLKTHVVNAGTELDLVSAFRILAERQVGAVVVCGDAFFLRTATGIGLLAAHHAIPSIMASRDFAEVGGLMTYGASLNDAHRQNGIYVGRVLKGEKVGDLPVVQPTKFELVINLKTARVLGLAVPPSLLAIADEVIE
jgi:putative tryptophan/tyrosine transport system substrate-binding protein